jgi:hypothetical protein
MSLDEKRSCAASMLPVSSRSSTAVIISTIPWSDCSAGSTPPVAIGPQPTAIWTVDATVALMVQDNAGSIGEVSVCEENRSGLWAEAVSSQPSFDFGRLIPDREARVATLWIAFAACFHQSLIVVCGDPRLEIAAYERVVGGVKNGGRSLKVASKNV